jgi:hypothetical protein
MVSELSENEQRLLLEALRGCAEALMRGMARTAIFEVAIGIHANS